MSEVPRTYFGDPIHVWMETDLDEPLLCLDLSEAAEEEVGELLINMTPDNALKLSQLIYESLGEHGLPWRQAAG